MRGCALFLLLIACAPRILFAQEKFPACEAAHKHTKTSFLDAAQAIEDLIARLRWTEQKIRYLTYHQLWQSRIDGMEPLSKDKRQAGQKEEERLLEVLQEYDRASENLASQIEISFRRLESYAEDFSSSCDEKNFRDCMERSFRQIGDFAASGRELFAHILENERSYRKNVDQASGWRKPLDPEVVVEDPVKHKDLFWRFEAELREKRFREDSQMNDFFQELRRRMTYYQGDECCLTCGRTAWEGKTAQLFHEVLQN